MRIDQITGEGKQCMGNTLDKYKTRTRATHESAEGKVI